MAFWRDRSPVARSCVKNLRIAREIPASHQSGVDERWTKLCTFLREEMTGLRELDLTVWSGTGSAASFPSALPTTPVDSDDFGEAVLRADEVKRWREWEWTKELLGMEGLKNARVTWWGFKSMEGEGRPAAGFDSWLAGRMVADKLARDRMVAQGVVVEGSLVLSGIIA